MVISIFTHIISHSVFSCFCSEAIRVSLTSIKTPPPLVPGPLSCLNRAKPRDFGKNSLSRWFGVNYTGELVGIQIGLEFLSELDSLQNRHIHILTDCQPAIKTAFGNQLPKNKIDIVFDIKSSLGKIHERKNKIDVHWVPGHKEIKGNELADEQAKEAASEMSKPDVTVEPIFDKKEAVTEIKKQMINKWNLKFSCSETASSIQDVFTEVGKRSCYGEWDRPTISALNQLLSGLLWRQRNSSFLDQGFPFKP